MVILKSSQERTMTCPDVLITDESKFGMFRIILKCNQFAETIGYLMDFFQLFGRSIYIPEGPKKKNCWLYDLLCILSHMIHRFVPSLLMDLLPNTLEKTQERKYVKRNNAQGRISDVEGCILFRNMSNTPFRPCIITNFIKSKSFIMPSYLVIRIDF
jgi:hypothetical protein